MMSNDQVQELRSENELLRIQLNDLNELISIREEELDILRRKAGKAAEYQSKLENTLLEMDYLQSELGRQLQETAGAGQRATAYEQEILEGIRMEKEFYSIRDKYNSLQAELADLQQEASSIRNLNQQISTLKTRVAELESALELIELDKGFLKEELEALRGQLPKTAGESSE
ncbi:MAG TPA: hypothetical protein PKW54_03745 [Ferruginibacter sp.]|nr:hypothetical protein [Ferruginibacter sp.]